MRDRREDEANEAPTGGEQIAGPPAGDGTAADRGAAAGDGAVAREPGSAAEGAAEAPGARPLGVRERAVLALERRGLPGPGAKERAVREQLGLSPVRYYQLLNALLDDPRALRHDPVTVNRLRRVRAARRRDRDDGLSAGPDRVP